MKNVFLSLLTLLLSGEIFAIEPPKIYPASRYRHLYDNSIVTDKPDIPVAEAPVNDLEDWVLIGSKKTTYGPSVIVVNSKDQTQRVSIPSPEASKMGFAILELKQNVGNYLKTEVQLQKGSHKGWVKYDQKFLALKKATPARAAAKKPGLPNKNSRKPNTRANQPPIPGLTGNKKTTNKKTTGKPRARVRYVPKPKPKK